MDPVVYTSPDILRWIDLAAKKSSHEARTKGRSAAEKAHGEGLVSSLKEAAGAAISLGKGAIGGIVQKSAETTRYDLHETGFESVDLARRIKITYSEVREIVPKGGDKYQVLFNGGSITVKPVAHLVAGRYKVPVGWLRNGIEVPYDTLVEELSARCGVEVTNE